MINNGCPVCRCKSVYYVDDNKMLTVCAKCGCVYVNQLILEDLKEEEDGRGKMDQSVHRYVQQ